MQWLSFFKKIQLLIDHMFISIRLFLAVHPSRVDFLYSVLASFLPKKSQVNFSPWRMKPIWSIDCLKCLRQCARDFATLSFIWVINLTVCGEREKKTKDNFLRFCLLQMPSIACDSFLLFLLFQIHFIPFSLEIDAYLLSHWNSRFFTSRQSLFPK